MKKSAFTIDTVLYLKKKYPKHNFIWLMGSDNLIDLHKWKSWKEIFYNIPIAILDRPFYSFTLTKFKSLVYFRKAKVSKSLIKNFKYFFSHLYGLLLVVYKIFNPPQELGIKIVNGE